MSLEKPLRLQVMDRIAQVLEAITAGEEYWTTTKTVLRKVPNENDLLNFPTYGVFFAESEPPEQRNQEVTEQFTVVVRGIVQSATDLTSEMEHAIADVRRAVDKDSQDGATEGALGALTVFVRVGRAYNEGGDVERYLGYFSQEFIIEVAGDPFGA